MLEITADKIAYIAILARNFQDGRSEGELRSFIADLNDDEQAALTAVMWIGRGAFEAEDLDEALATARSEKTTPTEDYLLGTPHLSDHLEAGMAALGLSPEDEEDEILKY